MSFSKKLILALDFSEVQEALQWVDRFMDFVKIFKVGKQLFTSAGPQIIRDIHRQGGQVFLDLKYHDIPNTVAGACREASELGVFMLTIHAMGGLEMMQAAREAIDQRSSQHKPLLIAVTVLTSFSEQNLKDIGIVLPLKQLVLQYAKLAQKGGMDGVVCSVQEAKSIKKECGEKFLVVAPGIRLEERKILKEDQKRSSGIEAALQSGADFLVLGRSLFQAKNPVSLLKQTIEHYSS
ncbi:MAG: orotidine-5'-phosphate decarboxylase [Deltaproteobacteria bacterium]|nr:orotidine-5'-phosphate decarboxylase [Deltaproteobacteria bacterium]